MKAGEVANPRPEPERKRGSFKELLKQQFRQLAQAVTLKPAQRDQRRRRKKDEARNAGFALLTWFKPKNRTRPEKQQKATGPLADETPELWTEMQWRDFYGVYHWTHQEETGSGHEEPQRPDAYAYAGDFDFEP